MTGKNEGRTVERGTSLALGIVLLVVGVVLLVLQLFGPDLGIDLGRLGWPVFIVVPGLALLLMGLLLRSQTGLGLSIVGGVVSSVGLLLAYQSAFDHFASWAYAWALVAPGGVGAAMVLWGALHRRWSTSRQGLGALTVGLLIFAVGFAFFEGVIGIGDGRGMAPLGRVVLPVVLIVAGVLLVGYRLWPRQRQNQ
ncbi:MAG TPA: hypothetical protein VMP67_03525 [Candidatus Limnocylindria bacterium]|nr:hypothetical protein [Candidatus Limnocylindria bacterium]